MLAFYWVSLGIVQRCRQLSDAKHGDNFRDQVTQELGTSVAVYLVTDSEPGEDLSDYLVDNYLRISSAAGKCFQPPGEAIRDSEHVLVALF
jgi:hypothetical protein